MNHMISLYLLVNNEKYILTLLLIGLMGSVLVLTLPFSTLHLAFWKFIFRIAKVVQMFKRQNEYKKHTSYDKILKEL